MVFLGIHWVALIEPIMPWRTWWDSIVRCRRLEMRTQVLTSGSFDCSAGLIIRALVSWVHVEHLVQDKGHRPLTLGKTPRQGGSYAEESDVSVD